MIDIVDAFDDLREQFERYSRNDLNWVDVRRVLDEAVKQVQIYRVQHTDDAISRFANAMRMVEQSSELHECTDDYLRHKLREVSRRDDKVACAYLLFLLWEREHV